MTNLRDYYKMLNIHDWYYLFSDDSVAYAKGATNLKKLKAIAEESKDHAELFKGFWDHHYTGAPWDGEKTAKPNTPSEGSNEEETEIDPKNRSQAW